jgi:DNA-binding NtrC family response regulator/pSer/pThr/pTyr-binding forkhead associated (FHA) protein
LNAVRETATLPPVPPSDRTTAPLSAASDAFRDERVWLTFYHRHGAVTVGRPPGTTLDVGRTPPADVVIADPSLSRLHARFTLQSGWCVVEDLGSTNGTRVGGDLVTQATVRSGGEVSLGRVTVVVHEASVAMASRLGLSGPGQLQGILDVDVSRAEHFQRTLALITVSSTDSERSHVRHWAERVQRVLRPVDQAAVYSPTVLQILLPEIDAEGAKAVAESIIEGSEGPQLLCGVACFPASGTSAQGLIEASREALRMASPARPLAVAPSRAMHRLSSASKPPPGAPVSESPAMQAVFEEARRFARGAVPILLQGETGVGKEVVARFIHHASPRSSEPLVSVNSAALPAHLVESTLFGHERGAFTGAHQRHEGVFESADGGTVLLDEIGDLPLEAQAKLLRVLEERCVTRVGSTEELPVDVRVIAATHRNLEAMVAEKRFRADLLYRLNVATIHIPPLRERCDDIPLLAARFLEQANALNGTHVSELSKGALAALAEHRWPGNVRELRNAIERAVLVAEGDTLTEDDLPHRLQGEPSPPRSTQDGDGARAVWMPGDDFRAAVERFELDAIELALKKTQGNQTAAARLLRMPRRTLVHKIKAYELNR